MSYINNLWGETSVYFSYKVSQRQYSERMIVEFILIKCIENNISNKKYYIIVSTYFIEYVYYEINKINVLLFITQLLYTGQ